MSESRRTESPDAETLREILDVAFVTRDLDEALDEVGAGDLTPLELRECVASTPEAREHFNRLVRAERGLVDRRSGPEGTDAETGPPADRFDRIFEEVELEATLDRVAAEPDAGASESGTRGESDDSGTVVSLFGGSRRSALAAAAAVALLAVGAVVVWNRTADRNQTEPFQPRSATTEAAGADRPSPRIQLYCVRRDGADVRFEAPTDSPGDRLRCPVDAELKVAYHNPSPRLRYAALLGIGPEGEVYWYGPSPAAEDPVEIETETSKLVGVGETIRLEVNHEPGRVRVLGLFSRRPLDFPRLSRIVESRDPERLSDGVLEVDGAAIRVDAKTMEVTTEVTK